VRGLVLHYYWVLRLILSTNPHIRKYLTRCKHCGIFFLTHPRNADRRDLRCPFGCRQYHRRKSSKERSAKYYRSEKGKKKKKALNERRYKLTEADDGREDLAAEGPSKQQGAVTDHKIDFIQDKGILSYIQMVIGLIEGRYVSMDEILKMLQKISRTHRIDRHRRFVYAFAYPRQRPP